MAAAERSDEPEPIPSWRRGQKAASQRRKERLMEALRQSRERADDHTQIPDDAWLPVLDLRIDPSYQRSGSQIDMKRVVDYAINWNWRLCGRLSVNQRPDGTYYVTDGGHRKAAYVMLYEGPLLAEAALPCSVSHLASREEEAEHFDLLNDRRVAVTYEQRFQSRLIYNETVAVQVEEAVTNAGLELVYLRSTSGHKLEPGQLAAIKTCETIVRQTNPATLEAVLDLIVEAWGGRPQGVHRTIISALYDFHIRFAPEYSREALVNLLRRLGPETLLAENPVTPSPRARSLDISLCLHGKYNYKRTTGRLSPFGLDGDQGIQQVIRHYREWWATQAGEAER